MNEEECMSVLIEEIQRLVESTEKTLGDLKELRGILEDTPYQTHEEGMSNFYNESEGIYLSMEEV